jgi:hypothetical protein
MRGYDDALANLRRVLGEAEFVSLGGGAMVIQCPLEGGWVWVTDEDDNLSPVRADNSGWWVGIFTGRYEDQIGEANPVVYASRYGTDVLSLMAALMQALAEFRKVQSA